MKQPSLFAPPPSMVILDGATLRDAGHAKVLAVDSAVADLLSQRLVGLLRGRRTITSDDLHDSLDLLHPLDAMRQLVQDHPNVIGATFRRMALQGRITDSGLAVKTQRLSGQSRRILVWHVTA